MGLIKRIKKCFHTPYVNPHDKWVKDMKKNITHSLRRNDNGENKNKHIKRNPYVYGSYMFWSGVVAGLKGYVSTAHLGKLNKHIDKIAIPLIKKK